MVLLEEDSGFEEQREMQEMRLNDASLQDHDDERRPEDARDASLFVENASVSEEVRLLYGVFGYDEVFGHEDEIACVEEDVALVFHCVSEGEEVFEGQ